MGTEDEALSGQATCKLSEAFRFLRQNVNRTLPVLSEKTPTLVKVGRLGFCFLLFRIKFERENHNLPSRLNESCIFEDASTQTTIVCCFVSSYHNVQQSRRDYQARLNL